MTNERPGRAVSAASTLLVTNLTKLVGVGVFVNEAAFHATARNSVLALCALFVLGAQVGENVLLRLIDQTFAERRGEPRDGEEK